MFPTVSRRILRPRALSCYSDLCHDSETQPSYLGLDSYDAAMRRTSLPANQADSETSANWKALTVGRLVPRNLVDLASGTIGAVRITSFLPYRLGDAVLDSLQPGQLARYNPARYPVNASRFGPTLNEYQDDGSLRGDYWTAATEAAQTWTQRMGELQVREHIVAQLSQAWDGAIFSARIQGRPVSWPIIREISAGTLLHWDDISQEYPNGLFDERIVHQFAMNIFLTAPERGGELRIWQRMWRPEDEKRRLAFGYEPSLLVQPPDLTMSPKRGDAVLFQPQHYHDVVPSDDGQRVTLSLFVGIVDAGLAMWS
jgi:2OG-Fe(II) oxygenase superfamily